MADRLSSLDTSFLRMEQSRTPLHLGSVLVFEPPAGGFDHERLITLISARIAAAPRYRQKVRGVPGNLANPVWVDDDRFDITYHVRRSALPRPGSDEQLEELVARIMPRQLDRSRPLWEAYLVEGLAQGRFAIVTKTHSSLVDGVHAVDLAHLIVDAGAAPGAGPSEGVAAWAPRRQPSSVDLLADAVVDTLKSPSNLLGTLQQGVNDLSATCTSLVDAAAGLVTTVARASARPAPASPLNAEVGRARRFVMIGTDLADYRRARSSMGERTGESVTTHDVVLATLTGAFRTWLLTRGEAVHPGTALRALVPVSVQAAQDAPAGGQPELTACYVDLPVGEPNPAMRLHQITYAMRHQVESGRAVPADTIAGLGGFASPTLHALGARLGSVMARRLQNVVVTNVPGPQQPLYAAGARMVSTFPVMPLQPGQALSVGLTSYDGGVYYGLYADREALPDLDVLGHALVDALAELVEATASRPSR